jgi:hemoglobin
MTNNPQDLIELAGGESALRALVQDFYDRVFPDVMIGYLFKGQDKDRLVQLELEFAMDLLGGTSEYTGRPMREAHAKHSILSGHFNRRLQILRETLADHEVPDAVREHWIEHSISLRDQVTPNTTGDCRPRRP